MKVKSLYLFCIILAILLLTSILGNVATDKGGTAATAEYDPWADLNNDGQINYLDAFIFRNAYIDGIPGQPVIKASIEYDSGWVSITDRCGQNITIVHNLNIIDWNDASIMVDIMGKTTQDDGLLRHLGLTTIHTQGWNETYGGISNDIVEGNSLVQTADGGYALAGYTQSYGAGDWDCWLVKTDGDGNAQWNKTCGGTGDDRAFSVVYTSDGGYSLAGYTESFGNGSADFWLVKIGADGNAQWNKTYGGTGWDEAWSLVQTVEGGYALAGFTSQNFYDAMLVKTDVVGNLEWSQTYGWGGDDRATSLIQTGDGGFALSGWFHVTSIDFWLMKTDSTGNAQWNKTYGGQGYDRAYSLVQTSDGGYVIAGWTWPLDTSIDFWLVRTDADGELGLIWTDSTVDTITLYRGATDPYWNYVRIRIWKIKEFP